MAFRLRDEIVRSRSERARLRALPMRAKWRSNPARRWVHSRRSRRSGPRSTRVDSAMTSRAARHDLPDGLGSVRSSCRVRETGRLSPRFRPTAHRWRSWPDDCEDEECPESLYANALDGSGLTDLGPANPGSYPDWGVRTPGGSEPDARCDGKQATIVGSGRDDSIVGTSSRDIINARGGSDLVKGLAGNDLLCGGKGKDRINGDGGNDRCQGGAGADRLRSCERRA